MTDELARINAAIASPPEPEPQSDADCRYQIPATSQAALRRMPNRLAAARQISSRVPSPRVRIGTKVLPKFSSSFDAPNLIA